jgi:hypothetical protein
MLQPRTGGRQQRSPTVMAFGAEAVEINIQLKVGYC